jgi:type I restriction enzyme M protein
MKNNTHQEMVNFIWNICNLLRGPYKRNEYRKVILPLTVLRRFDCILADTKAEVLKEYDSIKGKSQNYIDYQLTAITGVPFYNLSKLDMNILLNDPNNLAQNLVSYINGFSANIAEIMERFGFDDEIAKMNERDLLYKVIKEFAQKVDLSPDRIDNINMGYIFEELIRIGSEQSNEEAGEHFTPREVIKLMVNLILAPESEMNLTDKVVKIYDPTCGTGGMLSVTDEYIKEMNKTVETHLYGQDWNDEAWALCRADTLVKGQLADNIKLGCTFREDGFKEEKFDYMLANPPFGVSWKQQEKFINDEHATLGFNGRFGAGTPRVNDGSLLFLQHMISKMSPYKPEEKKEGSRIGIVFNGSPLFTGDAGSGESNIRKWIIEEKDMLEAVIALPDQLFYNTGISTYIWILSNKKETKRKGKVQLIDAREYWSRMDKSLGNKRKYIPDGEKNTNDYISAITKLYDNFKDNEVATVVNGDNKTITAVVSKIFDNTDFGYNKITVERPLRLNFCVNSERIALLKENTAFNNIAVSKKKDAIIKLKEEEQGQERQNAILMFLADFTTLTSEKIYKDRKVFLTELRKFDKQKDIRLNSSELKAVLDCLSQKDETAEICRDAKGNPETDTDLRDTENVPLKQDIDKYFRKEVKPHVPDAWIDYSKTKVGYEIPLTRQFYVYTPPRSIDVIDNEIMELEKELFTLLARGE